MASIQSINLGGKITGQHTMSGLSSARPLAGVGNKVILQPETQSVRIRFGAAPTSTVGLLITAGSIVEFEVGVDQSIHDFQVIEIAASATLNVIAISTK